MKKPRRMFILFVVVWLVILDYLVLTRSSVNAPILGKISEPFAIFTGRVVGSGLIGNPFIVLVIANLVIALLFTLSYFQWEKNKKLSRKKGR